MLTSSTNVVSLKGIPLTSFKVKGSSSFYEVYKVTKKDKNFLQDMYNSIDLTKLMPNMHQWDYINWDGILKEAIGKSMQDDRITYLETYNDKPCGIMNFSTMQEGFYLNFISTFPTERKKRVPCGGQILFNKLFKDFIKTGSLFIGLCALKFAPFNPISIYSKLGFKPTTEDDCMVDMEISKKSVEEALSKQSEFLSATEITDGKDIDLGNVINLNL